MYPSFVQASLFALIATVALPASLPAAEPIIHFAGEPVFSGRGCEKGSARFAFSPDHQVLSVIYDNYRSEVGGSTRLKSKKIGCKLTIPAQVRAGYMVAVTKVVHKGYWLIPGGRPEKPKYRGWTPGHGEGELLSTFQFEGSKKVSAKHKQSGPYDDLFELEQEAESLIWSRCGGPVSLKIESSLKLSTNYLKETAFAQIDSLDSTLEPKQQVLYQLVVRPCK
jgi:hypothetical protein